MHKFVLFNSFYRGVFTSVWFHWYFYTWKEFVYFNCFIEGNLPLCELTKMVFSILETFIYLKNIHLHTSVFQFISLKNNFVWVEYYSVSYTLICFPAEKYTPLCQLTKLMFLHLKIFSEDFNWRIFTSVRVDKDGVFTPENVFLLEEYTPLWELTKLKILYTQRMYTSMRVLFTFFSLENIYLCACTQK